MMAATTLLFLVAAVVPPVDELFRDSRVRPGVAELVYHAAIRIPVGTVLLEETAFRGVVPALARRRVGVVGSYVIASLLFGLWHVVPALSLEEVNPVTARVLGEGLTGKISAVALAVGGTFLAGLWLSFLRHRSASLLAPILAHVATNSIGYTTAWIIAS